MAETLLRVHVRGARKMAGWGVTVGTLLKPGDVIGLRGDLGAGKTTLSQGLARGLGVPTQVRVTSPSYALLNVYQGRVPVYHFDLYRLSHPDELIELDFDHILEGQGVVLVEWPDRFPSVLPEDNLDLLIEAPSPGVRVLSLHGSPSRWNHVIAPLQQGLR